MHRYTYSEVFAADMYATVFKKAPLDPALGKLYRDKILLPGGSRDETDLLKVHRLLLYCWRTRNFNHICRISLVVLPTLMHL